MRLGDRARIAALSLGIGSLLLPGQGCAYPRRTTALAPAAVGAGAVEYPPDLWRLEIVEASIPPRQRSGLPWDGDEGSLPDPYVRVTRGDEVLFESEALEDTLRADFSQIVPGNLHLPADARLQIAVWDRDGGVDGDDPIGVWRNRGVPVNAVPDGDLRLRLDSGEVLTVRFLHPTPHRGLGVTLYEARGDALRVLEVVPDSPAGRAGVRPGDDVVAIGGEPVDRLGETAAATALSLAADRGTTLTVRRDGESRDVAPDDGFVWLAR